MKGDAKGMYDKLYNLRKPNPDDDVRGRVLEMLN